MPRVKKTVETEETPKRRRGRPKKIEAATEETAPKRRRGRPAKVETAAVEETPKRRRGRPKKVVEEAVEETPRRRGRKAKTAEEAAPKSRRRKAKTEEKAAPKREREPTSYIFVDDISAKGIWDILEDGKDTRIAVNGENKPPRGERQKQLVEWMKGRKRKKVTAQNAIDFLLEDGANTANWTVANMLNIGTLSVAE